MAIFPDIARGYGQTSAPDYRAPGEWLQPSFQSQWLHGFGAIGKSGVSISTGIGLSLHDLFADTASTSSFLALSRRTSPQSLVAARSFADSLQATAASIFDWVEDREYEELFKQQVEPVPTGWIKQLSRFKSGPEIAVTWDDEDE